MNNTESLAIGVGMVPRGEISMVVALLALNSGAIEQPAYIAIVLTSLITAIFAPPALRNWVYRNTLSVQK